MTIERFPYGKAPLFLMALAALSSFLVVFAGRRPAEKQPDLVFALSAANHMPSYRRVTPVFERRHGVKVALQLVDQRALQTRLQNALLAGTSVPDLVELPFDSLGYFTRGPLKDVALVDLTERLDREGYRSRMVESRFSLWSSRERVFAVPHDVHPVMLMYRWDLVEALGIDVNQLETWDDFAAAGRKVVKDLDGDGIYDRYMIDLPISAGWGLSLLLLQRGVGVFDAQGKVAFNQELTVDTIVWYLRQTVGSSRIAFECGWGQTLMKAMSDGLALFFIAPDWRTFVAQTDMSRLRGKMKIMPLPAWEKGGRRTSVWGGTGLAITRRSERQELAWEFAKFLYFDVAELGKRFVYSNIIPPFKDAWAAPEFQEPNPYYSGQKVGALFARLAPETPPRWGTTYSVTAENKLMEVYFHAIEHYRTHGENGLREHIREELARSAAYVEKLMTRNVLARQ